MLKVNVMFINDMFLVFESIFFLFNSIKMLLEVIFIDIFLEIFFIKRKFLKF